MPTFHTAYSEARAAFLAAADSAGFAHTALSIPGEGPHGEALFIDMALRHNGPIRRVLVVSSGTHGVEGTFGSAVQLALLQNELADLALQRGQAVLLLHAINPWGMAHHRRVDAQGVDLNRNFRREGEPYTGAPEGYGRLDALLNPTTPPAGLDLFLAKAAWQVARHGLPALKEAVASGQYDFPSGLFWGGDGPSVNLRALAAVLPPLFGEAEWVMHLDLHTGSGPWGTYVHAVDLPDLQRVDALRGIFGAERIQGFDPSGVLYTINGALGPWLQALHPGVRYDCLLTEFGTLANLSVLRAMRYESRVVRHSTDPKLRQKAAQRMLDTFCPSDEAWRTSCVAQAREAVATARRAVFA